MVRWQGAMRNIREGDAKVKNLSIGNNEYILSGRATLVLAVIGLFGSMVFWSQNITGNVVLNFEKTSSNWIGTILFLLSVIGFLVYVQKRKK